MAPAQLVAKERTVAAPKGWSNPCVTPVVSKSKATLRLHHLSAPTCWWSWGYYGTLARIRLRYGNQVEINLPVAAVYEDLEHWFRHNGLTPERWEVWAKESQKKMGVPIFTAYASTPQPRDARAPMFATLAAFRQGDPKGERYQRALLRRSVVEGVDVTPQDALLQAAREADLDVRRFERDLADRPRLERDLAERTASLPPNVSLGFYNLAIADDRGRVMVLDHAFDPGEVEAAIEFLSGGKLRKNTPDDPVAYLRATGPAPAPELARAFAWPLRTTEERLRTLEKRGELRRVVLAGSPHWTAA